tara:strand:+ start:220 stop:1989 length:1770 start_codon:yes stop_codon:yes gene_type:complete
LLTPKEVNAKLGRLQTKFASRDQRMRDVLSVRQGDLSKVYPSMFSEDYPKPLVANFIDVAARDLAEAMAPLPSFNCSAANMVSDAARKAADTRTRIANFYAALSELQLQMYEGADWYNTYGMMVGLVEMDYDSNNPRLRLLNPWGVYPEMDRFGRTISLTQVINIDSESLAAQYPEFADQILAKNNYQQGSPYVSMIRYHDADQDLIFLPERKNLTLARTPNPIGKCLAKVAIRPSLDGQARGQFDDVLSVQLARARFAILQIQAAEKSIQAPIAIPQDVQELALGPDSIMRSAQPQNIRRVSLDLPPGLFAESGALERELRLGARYPESRSGNINASVITGRGVQELQAGFDTQIKSAQAQFARMFSDLLGLCFEIDEKLFPNVSKVIKGSEDGTPYVLKYTPSRDIKGEYGVDVRYGIMSGMDPSRAIIALLQMRSDKLVSRDYVRREIPMDLNVSQEEQRVDIEEMRDALRVSVAQYAQAIPALAAQGQDPSEIVSRIAAVIQGRQKGLSLESVVEKAFAPPPAPPMPEMPPQMPGMPGAEQMLPAAGAASAPASQQPPNPQGGQAPAAGQKPDIASLLAGITGAA